MTIEYFTEKEVSKMFRISRSALGRRRVLGLAPGYIMIGRSIRYPRRVLIEFVNSIIHKPINTAPGQMESSPLAAGYQPAVNAGPTPNNSTQKVEGNHD